MNKVIKKEDFEKIIDSSIKKVREETLLDKTYSAYLFAIIWLLLIFILGSIITLIMILTVGPICLIELGLRKSINVIRKVN